MSKTRFHSILETRINEAVEKMAESIANGHANDYANYRQHVGYISGLRQALKLCAEIEAESE